VVAVAAAAIGIGSARIIHGTDVFCALVLRPAAADASPSSIADLIGRTHDYGDRRLPIPGALSVLAAAIAAAARRTTLGRAGGSVALAALPAWLGIYARTSDQSTSASAARQATGDGSAHISVFDL